MIYNSVFLCIGSNLGDRLTYLKNALFRIADFTETIISSCSSVYESAPVGYLDQDDFLNIVVRISTNYSPELFLESIKKIEDDLGRVRKIKWGPRTIDIDILYWGNEIVKTNALEIPHPEVQNRKFVLVPLNEIAADFKAPPQFRTIFEILKNGSDKSWVELYLPKEKFEIN